MVYWQCLDSNVFDILLNENDQIFAGRPELLRVVDAENILFVGITLQSVGTCGVSGQYLGGAAVEFDFLVYADIYLCEILLVEA